MKNKEESDKPSSFSMTGVVEKNYEGSKFVLAVTVFYGQFSDKWVLYYLYISYVS